MQQFDLKEEEVASTAFLVGCSRYVWFNTVDLGEDRSDELIGTWRIRRVFQSAFLLDTVVHHQGLACLLCHVVNPTQRVLYLKLKWLSRDTLLESRRSGPFGLVLASPRRFPLCGRTQQ